MLFARHLIVALIFGLAITTGFADDILFIGNSFTFGASAPDVRANGGVPKLFEGIAQAKGQKVSTTAVTAGGKDWAYHLARPETAQALKAKVWTWVVLQDLSTRPTHAGNIKQFMQDGETFSDRIALTSPHAKILLYETWPRPAGSSFYDSKNPRGFTDPAQMMGELHQSYTSLGEDLAKRNPDREVRVALVGTAFLRVMTKYPTMNLFAADKHHANNDGYYLAALVLYESVYHDSVKGAPVSFFKGKVVIPADDAAKLQQVADDVAGG
jgi:hypothetical protein